MTLGIKLIVLGIACLPATIFVIMAALIYGHQAELEIMADKMYLFKKVKPD